MSNNLTLRDGCSVGYMLATGYPYVDLVLYHMLWWSIIQLALLLVSDLICGICEPSMSVLLVLPLTLVV